MAVSSIVPVVQPKPRRTNLWSEGGKSLVGIVRSGSDLKESIRQGLDLIGGPGRLIRPGDAVFLKPNFNSADPFPASTDMPFLRAFVELLREAGASKVTMGDCSGRIYWPSRDQFSRMGATALAEEMGIELLVFEELADWVKVQVGGAGHNLGLGWALVSSCCGPGPPDVSSIGEGRAASG
ncbi:MAG TPA: DUF362 domain-containing protein, partial [Chloroflexota bacterium]|nr:DUF362 domain-containing protein [Chloroflexota bacterium]